MRLKEQDYIIEQDFDVASMDYSEVQDHLDKMRDLEMIVKECVFIFDYYKHDYLYIKSYNEYFNEIPKQIRNPHLLLNSQIHPKDVKFVKQIHHRAFQYIFTIDANKRKDIQLFFSCKMKTNTGQYQMTNISIKLLKADSKGNIWLLMYLLKKAFSPNYIIPYLEIPEINDTIIYNFNNSFHLFSDAEKELVNFLFGDKTSSEIAEVTNKSERTIYRSIRNMYNKMEVTERHDFQKSLLYVEQ